MAESLSYRRAFALLSQIPGPVIVGLGWMGYHVPSLAGAILVGISVGSFASILLFLPFTERLGIHRVIAALYIFPLAALGAGHYAEHRFRIQNAVEQFLHDPSYVHREIFLARAPAPPDIPIGPLLVKYDGIHRLAISRGKPEIGFSVSGTVKLGANGKLVLEDETFWTPVVAGAHRALQIEGVGHLTIAVLDDHYDHVQIGIGWKPAEH